MNPQELLTTLLQAIVSAALPVLTTHLIKWVNVQTEELKTRTDNELAIAYTKEIADAITTAVAYTQQTFVDQHKDKPTWDKNAMRTACHMAMDKAVSLLTVEAEHFLNTAYGDVSKWLRAQIEAEVALQK